MRSFSESLSSVSYFAEFNCATDYRDLSLISRIELRNRRGGLDVGRFHVGDGAFAQNEVSLPSKKRLPYPRKFCLSLPGRCPLMSRILMEKRFHDLRVLSSCNEYRNQNSRDATRSLSIPASRRTKRGVFALTILFPYSTFFQAYGLHTKVIYLRNSFRFDFKWRELTADPPTTRTVVAGGEGEGEVLGRPSISPRRGKTPGYNEKYAASFGEPRRFLRTYPFHGGIRLPSTSLAPIRLDDSIAIVRPRIVCHTVNRITVLTPRDCTARMPVRMYVSGRRHTEVESATSVLLEKVDREGSYFTGNYFCYIKPKLV